MRIILFVLWAAACGPKEGQRCNPLQFSNECESGFQCVYPTDCPVAFCCSTASSNVNCQACAALDGGTD